MDEKIVFDQKTYQNQSDIQIDLLAAAHGLPNTNEKDLIFDPTWWSHLLLGALKGSFLQEAAGQAIFEIARSKEPEVRQFGIDLLFSFPWAKGADFFSLLEEAYQRRELDNCKLLIFCLSQILLEKRFEYSLHWRDFVDTRLEELFLLYFIYDRSWLKTHLPTFLRSDQQEQENLFFVTRAFLNLATPPLSANELTWAYQEMKPAFALFSEPVQTTFSSLLEEAIAKKRRLAQARFHNFSELAEMFCAGTGWDRETMEGFDEASLGALTGDERAAAEDIFVQELSESRRNDPRIPAALAAMKSLRAKPALQQRSQFSDHTAASCAYAVWQLDKDPEALQALLRIIKQAPEEIQMWALGYLDHVWEEIPPEKLHIALLPLLFHESVDIRTKSVQLLSKSLGVHALYQNPNSRLFRLSARLLNPLSSVWKPAMEDLTKIFTSLAQGTSATLLHLSTENSVRSQSLEQLNSYLFGDPNHLESAWVDKFDWTIFSKLQGEEYAWGEQWILQLIADQDPRGLEAVTALEAQWAIPALQESVLQSDSDQSWKKQAEATLSFLQGQRTD